MMFCLDDGTELLYGPASLDEPQTAILHDTGADSRPATVAGIHTTDVTQDLRTAMLDRKRRSRTPLIVIASIVVLAILGGSAWYLIPRKPAPPGSNMDVTKLVSGLKGIPRDVSISPDGKYVAYSMSEDGKSGLWLRQLSQEASIPIVPAAEGVSILWNSFSSDNERIYFGSFAVGQTFLTIYSVPIVGGKEPRKVKENVAFIDFTLSPDGSEIAFPRLSLETGEWGVFVARTDGSGEERKILSRMDGDWFDSIAWSPDGKCIATGFGTSKGGNSMWIELVPSQGGEPIPLGTHKFGTNIRSLTWLHDGSGLVATTAMSVGAKWAVWHISYPDGTAQRITKDLNAYFAVDVTADGKTAVMGYSTRESSLWTVGPDGTSRKIAFGSDDGYGGVAYLNDGRIIYTANSNDEDNLWIMNGDGSGAKELTTGNTGAKISQGGVSPDGKTIVFQSHRPDNVEHIWRVNIDGTELTQLTTGESYDPMFSRDGKWIVYTEASPTHRLMKIPAAGGDPTPVSNGRHVWYGAGFSEDGKLVACVTNDNGTMRTALIDLETGNFAGFADLPPGVAAASFSRSGREYIYRQADKGVANLWVKSVAGGQARQVTKFTEGFLYDFADAPDGKSFVMMRSHGTNEIVIAKNFR